MRIGRSGRTARWLAAAVGLGVAAGAVVIAHPAGASTTVTAQLALSGVATKTSPAGGSVVGVHPGDTVDFQAAPGGLPLTTLDNLGGLGNVLNGLVGGLVNYQVVLHLPATFPGGKRDVKLGTPSCGGKDDVRVSFPTKGTYGFTWSAYSLNLLCLFPQPITLDGNSAKKYGVALNIHNQYEGKVVVATDPPRGGIALQGPKVRVAPNVGGVQLPPLNVPGVNSPTLPVSPPSLDLGLPTGGSSSTPAPGGGSSGGINYAPPGQSIQDQVVPKGYGGDGGHSPAGLDSVLLNGLSGGTGAVPGSSGSVGSDAGATAVPSPGAKPAPTSSSQPVDLAANKAPSGQMPVLLAILAIVALSLVTATYARLYLMRRDVS